MKNKKFKTNKYAHNKNRNALKTCGRMGEKEHNKMPKKKIKKQDI